jgi:hypothetical protein
MRISTIIVAAGAAVLASCSGNPDDDNSAANAAANSALAEKAKPKHPTYCFFPEASETKGWAAKAGKDGNIVVTGKAHLEDRRYMGALGQPDVSGTSASVWLTMPPNSTGFGARDNWWDVTTTIPDSAAVTTVNVMCGTRTMATLTIPRKS